ncbi:MAG: class II aldolase/adducin family protein, partial [Oscillospiraceae bacterium]|nr:class II aldolase/adducin family protein [Oscillospiraceae bacterium]
MLNQLVALSNRYGQNPELVLAGGGNTSLKEGNTLYIKGSGTSLANIDRSGFVKMDRALLAQMLVKEYPDLEAERESAVLADLMAARRQGEENKRPSVETLLHDLFEYRFVVHTHPALVNGLTCGQKGAEIAARLFGVRAVWVPLVKPGYVLALEVKREMDVYKAKTGRAADLILLQNHGIFAAGDTEAEVDAVYKEVLEAIESCLIERPDFSSISFNTARVEALKVEIEAIFGGNAVFIVNAEVAKNTAGAEAFYPVSSVFTPDHIVYCKHTPLFVPFADNLSLQCSLLNREMEA